MSLEIQTVPAARLGVEPWLRGAVALCTVDVVLLVVALWPGVVEGGARSVLRVLSVAISLALLTVVFVLVRRLQGLSREMQATSARQHQMFDALASGAGVQTVGQVRMDGDCRFILDPALLPLCDPALWEASP